MRLEREQPLIRRSGFSQFDPMEYKTNTDDQEHGKQD